MDLQRKFENFKMYTRSISEHKDVDANVRKAMLAKAKKFIDDEVEKIEDEVAEQIKALDNPARVDHVPEEAE